MGDKNKTKMAAKLLSSTPIPRRDSKRQRVGSNSCPKCDDIVEEDRKGLGFPSLSSVNNYKTSLVCIYCFEWGFPSLLFYITDLQLGFPSPG
jgi:hypothetical protein